MSTKMSDIKTGIAERCEVLGADCVRAGHIEAMGYDRPYRVYTELFALKWAIPYIPGRA